MFVNVSNHPSSLWDEKQLGAARVYGEVVDVEFPQVPPEFDTNEIISLAEHYLQKIMELKKNSKDEDFVVHVMGEFTFCFCLTRMLQRKGIKCVASTTTRETQKLEDGSTVSKFNFYRFREYPVL